MSAEIMDGKAIASEIQKEIAQEVEQFTSETGVTPCLAAVLVGDDPASQVYVRNKERACERVGIASQLHRLPPETTQSFPLIFLRYLGGLCTGPEPVC